MSPPTTFGKRKALPGSQNPTCLDAAAPVAPGDYDAFFAAARHEMEEAEDTRPLTVPYSFRAAILAGLCVGCALVGLDVTHAGDKVRDLSGFTLDEGTTARLLPALILIGLIGGARAAAMSIVAVHWGAKQLGTTHHAAYAAGGAIVAGGLAALEAAAVQAGLLSPGHLPTHGFAIDIAAGAAAGLLYRVFAGSRRS